MNRDAVGVRLVGESAIPHRGRALHRTASNVQLVVTTLEDGGSVLGILIKVLERLTVLAQQARTREVVQAYHTTVAKQAVCHGKRHAVGDD